MRVIIEYDDNSLGLLPGETVVGRGVHCHLRFNDPAVSRMHARFIVQENRVLLEDLGTTNGTLLNDERVSGTRILAHGDRVTIGRRVLAIKIVPDATVGAAADADSFEDTTEEHGALIAAMARRQEDGALLVIRDYQLGEAPPKVTHHNCPGCRTPLALEDAVCPRCGTRPPGVRSMAKTLEITRDMFERRRQPRRRTNIPCLYTSDSLTFEAHASDVSRDGLFIASELTDEPGTPCAVTLLPDGQPPRTLVGVVSRVVDSAAPGTPRGMGIRLSTMGDNR
jgi:predicted component of type VI protein secretion system